MEGVMISILTLCILLMCQSVIAINSLDKLKGLKFADNQYSYIRFTPNMTPFVNKISVCSWLRNLGSGSYLTAFDYGSNTVRFDGKARFICISSCFNMESAVTVPDGTWLHACSSWSSSSGSLQYYVNGKLLGTKQFSGVIPTGHDISVGNHLNALTTNAFGGEMFQLNVYAKELSGEEIKRMADAGMCSFKEDENEEVRVLKWEDLLKKSRTGTVTEFIPGQCVEEAEEAEEAERKMNETATQLSATQQSLAECQQSLEESQQTLEETVKEKEVIEQTLNQTQTKLNSTELQLEAVSAKLNRTANDLRTALKQLEQYNQTSQSWDWDLFILDTYVNTTISSEVAEQIRSSWDNIAEMMIGFTITDQFITFLKHIDTDECSEQRPWTMLYTKRYLNKVFTREDANSLITMWDGISESLVGVQMTRETVELLKYIEKIHHQNCTD